MPPSRRKNNSSLFESTTIITANLIMASSSYLLSKITPRTPAAQSAPPAGADVTHPTRTPVTPTRSVEPTGTRKTVLIEPNEGEDSTVDERADVFINNVRKRIQRDHATAAPATGKAAAWQTPPPPVVPASK